MEIKDFLEANRKLKRRLDLDGHNRLHDSTGQRVDAKFIAVDKKIIFPIDSNRLPDKGRSYIIDGIDPIRGHNFITESEGYLILGYDAITIADEWDLQAMLTTCAGGFGGSRTNAYYLGPTMQGRASGVKFAEIPVAYFIIPKEDQKRLAVDLRDTKYRGLVESLAEPVKI